MIPPRVFAAILALTVTSSMAAAEEYNFNDNQDVNDKDCWAMETRIDKYLALADAELKSATRSDEKAFTRGRAYLAVAADFTQVFDKFCEDG